MNCRFRNADVGPAGCPLRTTVLVLVCALLTGGCSRSGYRLSADRDTASVIAERTSPEYLLPDRNVEASPISRMADFADPDCGPLPPDDPSAARFMEQPYRSRSASVWRKRGRLPDVEFEAWREHLPGTAESDIRLNRDVAMQLALLHSRRYQTAVESVYLSALPVTLERFAFDARWFGGFGLNSVGTGGNTSAGSRVTQFTDSIGFRRQFATGGELLASLSNALVWEHRAGVSTAGSVLAFEFLQPLMRRAFREVQLEPLTQAERSLLYEIRDFARFRQEFSVDTVGSAGYLGLLAEAQGIRNEEANLVSLERNLAEHDALLAAGLVSQFQVDQVYQDYQQGLLSVLQARAAFDTAIDRYLVELGLPPTLTVVLDSEELRRFELNATELEELQERNEQERIALLQYSDEVPAGSAELARSAESLSGILNSVPAQSEQVREELQRWQVLISRRKSQAGDSSESTAEASEEASSDEEAQRQQELHDRLLQDLDKLDADLADDRSLLSEYRTRLAVGDRSGALMLLNQLSGEHLRARLADLFVIQTQVRVYLIDVRPVEISESSALMLARMHRLDLRNEQGRVVDAYRQVEVTADLLEADLDVILGADLGTDSGRSNPARFDVSASTFRAGFQFDGPLNRLAERNSYRASQIFYQQSRRNLMAARDAVDFDVRNNLRNLNLDRFQFEITRQQLITAARQVEQAQFNLRSSTEPDSNLTRDLLQALQSLLRARNSLISSWVSYETSRMELYSTLGVLQIDDNGNWINDGQPLPDSGELSFVSDTP